ncbi:MAG: hypothetical protein COB78_10195 [Hyphomicrobiales bacterium]|nr:MAG: hypothetical protein COB78_10195 [Hyphomicrobiales bacterium]
MRRPGAFKCFVNPDQSALDAHVFWTDESYRRVVIARVCNCNHVDGDLSGIISLGGIRCRKSLLKAENGTQYLLLADQCRVAQVKCIGENINLLPFLLEPIVENFPDVESVLRLIKNLADICRNRSVNASNMGWTAKGLRHRDALAAFDCRSRGYSYREIAIFIHGESDTIDAWNNPSQTMKNRIIRSVKRGERMVAGHYKSLLK